MKKRAARRPMWYNSSRVQRASFPRNQLTSNLNLNGMKGPRTMELVAATMIRVSERYRNSKIGKTPSASSMFQVQGKQLELKTY